MHRNKYVRALILLLVDSAMIAIAFGVAYWLRFDLSEAEMREQFRQAFYPTLCWFVGIRALCGLLSRQYIWTFLHASLSEAVGLALTHFIGTALLFALFHLGSVVTPPPPRSVYVLELFLTLGGVGFVRYFPRYLHQRYLRKILSRAVGDNQPVRTLIFGAGGVGELLLRDISRTRVYPYNVIGFVDDDPGKSGVTIHGVRVLGTSKDLPELIEDHAIDKLLIAVPDLSAPKLRSLIDLCGNHHVRFKIVPSFAGVVSKGDAGPLTLKDVQPEDLLERATVEFDHGRMASVLVDHTALVTGAAGSIGSELCRQLARNGIKRIIALDLNENGLYFLRLDLNDIAPKTEVLLEVANVRDMDRMRALFARYRPHLVFHAAAHKHVPLMEACPVEALKNNVLGTYNAALCAIEQNAERFVLISTDKAVRSTNVMGASKRMAECIVPYASRKGKTRFTTVRFGNVLGSNGSLLPILQRQVSRGGPVTITHPNITRYFMTIPEAVGLVLIAMMQEEGQLCVLDMGEPVNIDHLARQLITLHGMIPDQDIAVEYTGLRPGEKMYEELFCHTETLAPSSHPRILLATGASLVDDVDEMIRDVTNLPADASTERAQSLLRQYVRDYRPFQPDAANAEPPPPPPEA